MFIGCFLLSLYWVPHLLWEVSSSKWIWHLMPWCWSAIAADLSSTLLLGRCCVDTFHLWEFRSVILFWLVLYTFLCLCIL